MEEPITTCPIWGSRFKATGNYDPENDTYYVEDSGRAFAGYRIKRFLLEEFVKPMSDDRKALLTTWLIDQFNRGNYQPEITIGVLAGLRRKQPLSVQARADRLLTLLSLAAKTQKLGSYSRIPFNWYTGFAWSESTDHDDVQYLVEYLGKMGWLESDPLGPQVAPVADWRVSVEGHARADELQRAGNITESAQCFIAMWFHESMNDALERGIEPAIEEAGYEPFRIDRKEHINKIDDEIIVEIRRSRFLVADFTQGEDGARGGVYYEAGFAHGLGIPVIFTCHEDVVETLHFDTNHYNHIVWCSPADLGEKLKNRILAVIGPGQRV